MPRSTALVGFLLAGLAVTTVAACDGGSSSSAAPATTAPSASPSASASASSRPVVTPPTARPTRTKPSGGGGGGGSASAWHGVDFPRIMFTALECPAFDEAHGKAEVLDVRYADLTGDGLADAVVGAACFTTTAANPARVLIFDGADTRTPLRTLVTIGRTQFLTTVKTSTYDRTVTVSSKALSARAGRCCPDLLITQEYAWDGERFNRVRLQEKKTGE